MQTTTIDCLLARLDPAPGSGLLDLRRRLNKTGPYARSVSVEQTPQAQQTPQIRSLDRMETIAVELLELLADGSPVRPTAEALFAKRRGFLPVGASVDELVSTAATIKKYGPE